MSRASSPENDFVDVESTDNRPQSSASGTSQRPSTSTALPVTPETKRNRGRPRKLKENSDDRTYFLSHPIIVHHFCRFCVRVCVWFNC